ncbi:MAG: NAD(P)H-dependent glycerol-3-phosphate dehydrogenase [Myxococcota bacterium]
MGDTHPVVTVLGAGSWGTALAKHLADQGYETRLWARRAEQAAAIEATRKNPNYLKDIELPTTLRATADLDDALEGATLTLVVVPTEANRELLKQVVPKIGADVPVVSATKGIEQGTLDLVSQIFEESFPEDRHSMLTYLGGPSFAREVAQGVPTAVTLAGKNEAVRQRVQRYFNTERFRVYTTDDVIGVEVGGALKNVVAIAAGIADGMKLGHNTRAALITRGLAELSRLALRVGAHPLTMSGLGGMGDLVLTCTGDLSRNRRVGIGLGQGKKLPEILEELGMVAEGVKTAKSAHNLARKLGVDMPITDEVYAVLYDEKPAKEALVALMTRPLKEERD